MTVVPPQFVIPEDDLERAVSGAPVGVYCHFNTMLSSVLGAALLTASHQPAAL